MEWPTTVSAIILLIFLRVAVPIAITVIFIKLLKWLDERWKKEADLDGSQAVQIGNIGCWDINKCPAKLREECRAFNDPDKPCWQIFRDKNGRLQEKCIGCYVFRHSPTPVMS
jgi:hypothetical protein